MHRAGGPSKASATTVCQKCLKKGHYSYECTASQQDRPYISRPSRSQQLLNPKLAPKIAKPPPTAVATSKPKQEISPARKSDPRREESRGRRESSYSSGSNSVSTISTRSSRSPSPPPARVRREESGKSLDRRPPIRQRSRSPIRSRSPCRQSQHRYEEGLMRRRRSRSRSRSPVRGIASHNASRDLRFSGSGAKAARERSLSPYSKRVAMTRAGASNG